MSLLNVIKQAGVEAVNASKPVNIIYGTVTSISPLSIQIDQRLMLKETALALTESVTRLEIDLSHTHAYGESGTTEEALIDTVVIREGLKIGDNVILIRVQGGQKYIVLDRVVGE